MAVVLVTGGTGTLGRHLVPLLLAAGDSVRVMSRTPGEGAVIADLMTGGGLEEAVAGVDVVVHAATDPLRARRVDLVGTGRLIERLISNGRAHLLYVSIVGVDRHALPYYKAKWAAEQLVKASPLPWTILRAVQFHELLDKAFTAMRPVLVTPKGFRFQPVAAAEAASRIADLVAQCPGGRATDLGGPEMREMDDLAMAWKRVRGRASRSSGRLCRAASPGPFVKDSISLRITPAVGPRGSSGSRDLSISGDVAAPRCMSNWQGGRVSPSRR